MAWSRPAKLDEAKYSPNPADTLSVRTRVTAEGRRRSQVGWGFEGGLTKAAMPTTSAEMTATPILGRLRFVIHKKR
jgi:hypothetical protein